MQKKFAFQTSDTSKEMVAIHTMAILNRDVVKFFKSSEQVPTDFIPCGSVEWVMKVSGLKIVPNYYPDYLQKYLYRKVWKTDTWPIGQKVFIKSADRYKKFNGFITDGTYKGKKKGTYWCSEIITFENEFRYYVSNGKILCGEWYCGSQEQAAPELNIELPSDCYAALDFGTSNGQLTLVEAQHPFACGWYGKESKLYYEWIVKGWDYIKKLSV